MLLPICEPQSKPVASPAVGARRTSMAQPRCEVVAAVVDGDPDSRATRHTYRDPIRAGDLRRRAQGAQVGVDARLTPRIASFGAA